VSVESEEDDGKEDGNQSQRSNQSAHSMVMDKEGRKESRAIAKDIKRMSHLTAAAKAAIEAKQEVEKIKL